MEVIACGSATLGLSLLWGARSVKFLDKDEQLRVRSLTETKVLNGPGVKIVSPISKFTRVKALCLGPMEYCKVRDTVKGEVRVERGPSMLFLQAYDELVHDIRKCYTLGVTDYLITEDQMTGHTRLVKGPSVWCPGPYDVVKVENVALALQADEYARVKDTSTGQRWVVQGKTLLFLEPNWEIEGRAPLKAWTLKGYEYVRLIDNVTGKVTVHKGEKTVFPGADEELLDRIGKQRAIDLKVNEYVKIMDQTTGEVRVCSGVDQVFLGPNEIELDGGKQLAVQVDEELAVLVRDQGTGQLRLVTEKQLFIPGPNEAIERKQTLIKLADHEAVIVKDKDGVLNFHYGNPEKGDGKPRSFFLPPYHEIMQLWWSSGLRRAKRDLCIERFDCRSQYMWFEFDVRTCDNVELVLECTFFWEVVDLAKLVRATGNLPGDIYNQARSQFIKEVAHVTLKGFMEQLHTIAKSVYDKDAPFYEKRGVKIHSLEVTKYFCSERRTSEVLQQIIEETTNRLNRLSQAESENEVKMFKMQGQIEQEKLNGELLEIQQAHTQSEGRVQGATEGDRVAAFIAGLAKEVPKLEDRIAMWQVLRKTEALSVVSSGGAHVYYTPNDVNLSIETKNPESA